MNNYNTKRTRFNSDDGLQRSQHDNYYDNKYGYKNSFNRNYGQQEIEVDISKMKYPSDIKYKYTFQEIKNYYLKFKETKYESNLKDGTYEEIIRKTPKEIITLDDLIVQNEKAKLDNQNNINTNINVPKSNPLSKMNKNFNKFDMDNNNF